MWVARGDWAASHSGWVVDDLQRFLVLWAAWALLAELFLSHVRRWDPRSPVQCPQLLVDDVPDQVRAHR